MLQAGDILLCKNTKFSFFGKLISFCTKSDIIHAALFIEIWGQPFIIDAQNNGITPKPFEEWLEKYSYDYEVFRKEDLDLKKISKTIMSFMSVDKYPYFRLAFTYILHYLTNKWYFRGKNNSWCSTFVGLVYDIPNADLMTPVDLKDYCNNTKEYKKIK